MTLPEQVARAILTEGQFWLVLVQPARFTKGRLVDSLDEVLRSLNVDIVTSVRGRPLSLGGFDLMNKRPGAMFRYVPAGSAYLLRFKDQGYKPGLTKMQEIHDTCCLGDEKERRMGFGHVMIGRVFS